nr:MAG TPA: hypothetical protein [Caudoviricetes sp.]
MIFWQADRCRNRVGKGSVCRGRSPGTDDGRPSKEVYL